MTSLRHFTARLTASAALAATLATAGVAGAADAPVVSGQRWIAGASPVTVPGTGVHKGDWLGTRQRLVFRQVKLEGDQRARLTLRAPKGKRIRGLGVPEGQHVGFTAVGSRYVGRRSVTVRAYVAPTAGGGEVTGQIYALTR